MITPNDIPADAAPIDDTFNAYKNDRCNIDLLFSFEGKNVHVGFNDGSFETGLLHSIDGYTFVIGNNFRSHGIDVKSYREV
jgi:hypothetical protein